MLVYMDIDNQIAYLGYRRIALHWWGTADWVSIIFVNSELAAVLSFGAETERTLEMDVPELAEVEIHEFDPDEASGELRSIIPDLSQHPIVRWSPVDGVDHYDIYHRIESDGDENYLQDVVHIPGVGYYERSVLEDLVGDRPSWRFFRVEAVSTEGKPSTTMPWPHYVKALPPEFSDAVLTGAAGVFLLTLTP